MRKLLFVVFALISMQSVGQIHLGATGAYNATFVLDKGLQEDPRYNGTYTYNWAPIGFTFGVDIGRKFGISLESIVSKQGQIYDLVNTAQQIAGERKIDLKYINIPLLFNFKNGSSRRARPSFGLGPQMAILQGAVESVRSDAGDFEIPEGVDFADIQKEFPNAVNNNNGTYTIPSDLPSKDLLTKEAGHFKDKEFQLAGSLGLDIDLSRHLFLSTLIRANYSFTDMRNEDVLDAIKSGNVGEIFGQRANVLIGVQFGLHYYFGVRRSFKDKEE